MAHPTVWTRTVGPAAEQTGTIQNGFGVCAARVLRFTSDRGDRAELWEPESDHTGDVGGG